MSEAQTELCGKCGAGIDPTRRVDFTLKDGTRVCDSCFVKETPRQTHPRTDWPNRNRILSRLGPPS
jgi:NMD protein affecting ribosome stability and mRNA decay